MCSVDFRSAPVLCIPWRLKADIRTQAVLVAALEPEVFPTSRKAALARAEIPQ